MILSRWFAAPVAALGLAASALVGSPGVAAAASSPADFSRLSGQFTPGDERHYAPNAPADDDGAGNPTRPADSEPQSSRPSAAHGDDDEPTGELAGPADSGPSDPGGTHVHDSYRPAGTARPADAAASGRSDASEDIAGSARPGGLADTGRPAGPYGHSGTSCLGLVPPPYAYAAHSAYFCGDWRLGPARLPVKGLLGNILYDYQRLGTLTPVEFVNKYWNPLANKGQGDWFYPTQDGFQLGKDDKPIKGTQTLHIGRKVDRFGAESGRFMSPAGAPYKERSLPPSNLDTMDPRYPFNYHLYRVAKEFTVASGPVAAWFEQPGQGVQYMINQDSVGKVPANTFVNVDYLVKNGYLVRLN